jgi:hypothetical protein
MPMGGNGMQPHREPAVECGRKSTIYILRTGEKQAMSGGRFEKGKSGNPGGRPRIIKSLQVAAREYAAMALATLAEIAEKGESESGRVAASRELLDRGFGKPVQNVDMRVLMEKRLAELTPAELDEFERHLEAEGIEDDDAH